MPMKATSTMKYAFTDGWNLAFLALFGGGLFFTVWPAVALGEFIPFLFLFTLLFLLAFIVQIWGMLNITLAVSDSGLNYRAAYRKVALQWEEIEAVHLEPAKKQITFWVNGKKVRMHEFGLHPGEYAAVKAVMIEQIERHQIEVK